MPKMSPHLSLSPDQIATEAIAAPKLGLDSAAQRAILQAGAHHCVSRHVHAAFALIKQTTNAVVSITAVGSSLTTLEWRRVLAI
ncbi:hypothetical protein MA20_45480 [Bradyrhizobium japonicum]|uniref:Uncharacterized protein n=2 Tax=Bradyrhizobium japonicum TaxID=375 RepID=A0A0A3XJ00_BRAJP|nr:hypothetical protein MA20_45480 [Bradyrhizobium japonicum]